MCVWERPQIPHESGLQGGYFSLSSLPPLSFSCWRGRHGKVNEKFWLFAARPREGGREGGREEGVGV